jgi:hypothetical protein
MPAHTLQFTTVTLFLLVWFVLEKEKIITVRNNHREEKNIYSTNKKMVHKPENREKRGLTAKYRSWRETTATAAISLRSYASLSLSSSHHRTAPTPLPSPFSFREELATHQTDRTEAEANHCRASREKERARGPSRRRSAPPASRSQPVRRYPTRPVPFPIPSSVSVWSSALEIANV